MEQGDRDEVAELICVSTNVWYQTHAMPPVFPGGPTDAAVFFDVYEALDPGCGLVAENAQTGRLAGSCFYHPRPTHISLGIMNVQPNYFRRGIARMLLGAVFEMADREGKPLRLISSALNLDSFSLYTRAGFVPQAVYQSMLITVPAGGLPKVEGAVHVRPATVADVQAMVELEMELAGINRQKDFRYFLDNRDGFWHVSVYEGRDGKLDGFTVSSGHPAFNIIGPGAARTATQAIALVRAELNRYMGKSPIVFAPVQASELVLQLYQWGGRNGELVVSQIRGPNKATGGIILPTILPESG
jgi:GNAT superfamily N-acetyltransferase